MGIEDAELLSQMLRFGQKEQYYIFDYFVRDNKMLIEVYLKTTNHSC